MRTVSCIRCDKVFNTIGSRECPECREKLDGYLRQAKDYLFRNPDLSLSELSEKAEVTIDDLTHFIKQGRLAFKQGLKGELTCEMCGKEISSGPRCSACQEKVTKFVRENAAEIKRSGPSMHSMDFVRSRREER